MMAKIQLRDVSFDYSTPLRDPVSRVFEIKRERNMEDLPVENTKGVKALDHVNLTVPNGQTFVIVGPSGCGKSTLLRVVAGLINDYSGQVFYDGEDVQNIPTKDRYIGMVFQSYALYPNFNNEGNLSFFFKLHKIDDEETRERIRYTSQLMGIGFDEPLSSLDAKLRVQTRTEIKRLLHRFGITSLYVTHDQVEAIALADQIVIMHRGKIEQVGTYQDLIENPANTFVAGFLGLPPMDLFSVVSISGRQLILDDYSFSIPNHIFSLVENGQLVTMGVRREAVNVSAETPSANGIQLRAEVDAFESDFVHHIQIVHVRTGRFTYSGLCSMDVKLHMGQLVYVVIDPERLYFFDTK